MQVRHGPMGRFDLRRKPHVASSMPARHREVRLAGFYWGPLTRVVGEAYCGGATTDPCVCGVVVCGCLLRTQQCVELVLWVGVGAGSCLFVVCLCLFCLGWVFVGEFDPGSGRTLAACLTHASRTGHLRVVSGERVSNTWVICPVLRDKPGKLGLIPDRTVCCMVCGGKMLLVGFWRGMGLRLISLLVG